MSYPTTYPKRKWDEVDSSDDEEPSLGKQVLPVANLPADFAGDPEDGLQYLFLVRRDARSLPRTTRVTNPYELPDEPQAPANDEDLLSTAHSALPSESWREVFVTRFRNFRKNTMQPSIHANAPSFTPGQKLTPGMKERDAWWAFLTGRPESEWDPPKKPKKEKNNREPRYDHHTEGIRSYRSEYEVQYDNATPGLSYATEEGEVEQIVVADPTESLPTPFGSPAPPDKASLLSENGTSNGVSSSPNDTAKIIQREPTPLLLQKLDHRYSLHLLMYFAHWINLYLEQASPQACAITETHARWMFALLSRVDDFLSADEMSTLRSLARGCMGLIKDILQKRAQRTAPDVETDVGDPGIAETSCWLVVAAVAGLWGQRDLWQDAESMLADIESPSVASTPS